MQVPMTIEPSQRTALANLLAELPEDVRASFSDAQIAALTRSSQAGRSNHLVDFRVSMPLMPARRYYFRLLVGRERRNLARLTYEGQAHVTTISIFYALVTAMLAGLLLFGIFCAVYLLKSLSGINLFEGESPLHPLYLLLRNG